MRVVRFRKGAKARYGILDSDDTIRPLAGDPYELRAEQTESFLLREVDLLAPCEPAKVIGVGLNYRDHAVEMGFPLPEEPMLFLMPGTSVIGPGEKILYPEMSAQVDYEGELGVVIGRRASHVSREEAGEYILGYTCANDVTARDLQMRDGQFTRAKGFDTFAPLGPWIETDLDPAALTVETFLNGERKQVSSTEQLVFDPFSLVSFLSKIMTLLPGDAIMTGTPAGIGPMVPGDRVEVRIQGIGALINEVCTPE
jgi:2-keto-4-pentenoate hydratase/2-oxohepta-3-ene-1,7-dioic acid hydratase in catechol pathway